jgi:hypothetical protein
MENADCADLEDGARGGGIGKGRDLKLRGRSGGGGKSGLTVSFISWENKCIGTAQGDDIDLGVSLVKSMLIS